MKQILRLLRTFIFMGLLVWWSINVYAKFQEKDVEVDPIQSIYNLYQTWWYETIWEYTRDIEFLQWEKQKELDKLDYESTINYSISWSYDVIQISQEKLDLLKKIDRVILLAQEKMGSISTPAYLEQKPEIEQEKEDPDAFWKNLWK